MNPRLALVFTAFAAVVSSVTPWQAAEAASAACQGVTDETSAAKAVRTSARRGFTACSWVVFQDQANNCKVTVTGR